MDLYFSNIKDELKEMGVFFFKSSSCINSSWTDWFLDSHNIIYPRKDQVGQLERDAVQLWCLYTYSY